jgi:cytidylate kinase
MTFNIAIDGPAGAGKSTIAKIAANKLGFIYVDTGALYRAIAYYMLENSIDINSESSVSKLCEEITVRISYEEDVQQIYLNDKNVTNFIRTEKVGKVASVISAYAKVRETLLSIQRNIANKENVIMDGRDIASFVLPNAQLKIYLTASSKIRAKRRYEQLKCVGVNSNIDDIETEIINRDERDMNRVIAPLIRVDEAVLLDTSDIDIEEVLEKIIVMYEEVTGVR